MVIGIETGCKKEDIVKISRKKESTVISLHKIEKIVFAYIMIGGLDRKEIEGVPRSLTEIYEERLKKETRKLSAWAQEEGRKKTTVDWLVAWMYENKLHNLSWLSNMYLATSEEYWGEVIKKAGIKEEMRKYKQYISANNIFVLCALEYSKKNNIPAPFDLEEIPLPQTKEIYVIRL